MWNFQNLTLCSWRDLNPGPRARDPNALPTELSRLNEIWAVKWNFYKCYTKIFKRKERKNGYDERLLYVEFPRFKRIKKQVLPGGELNPGLPRERRDAYYYTLED